MYRDFSAIDAAHARSQVNLPSCKRKGPRGGVVNPFPVKLFSMLEAIRDEGLEHVVSWQVHGRCFMIHKPDAFVADVLPRFFRQTKLPSFQRQLNLWHFQKVVNGPDRGGYYHELFLRGRPDLAPLMLRVKGCAMEGVKIETSTVEDPDFYAFPYCEINCNKTDGMMTCGTSSSTSQDHTVRPEAALIEPSTPPDSPRSNSSVTTPPRRRRRKRKNHKLVVTPPYESRTIGLDEMNEDESSRWTERRKLPFQHDIRELHLAHDPSESSLDLVNDDDDDDDDIFFQGRTFQSIEECNAQALESILSLEEEALYAKSVLSEVKRMKLCLGMNLTTSSCRL